MTKEKFTLKVIQYRWAISILVPLMIIALFVANIKNAGMETDFDIWFDKDSKVMKNFKHFKSTFGSDDRLLLAMRSEDGIFNKKTLKSIQSITDELWQTKYIARVDSITNFQYAHVSSEDPDEIIVEDFLDDIDNISDADLKIKEKIARTDTQTKNLLISADGKSAVIIARMVYSQGIEPKSYIALYNKANILIDKYKLDGVEYHNIGVPAGTNAFVKAITSNVKTFLPMILLVIIVLLAVIFRSILSVLLPLGVVILTVLFIAGLTFGLGYKLNTITTMFPIFIIAIGIADSIHIFWVWKHKRQEGMNNQDSILFSIEKNFFPAFITSLTTFVGFLSLGISKIVPLQAFGLTLASGALMAFILSVTLLPALLSIINPNIKVQKKKTDNLENFIKKYTQFISRNDKTIIIIFLLIIGIIFIGFKDVVIDTDFMKQFSKETQIRKSADFVEKNIGGTLSIEIIIDSKEPSGVNKPDLMQDVENFNEEFKAEFPRVRHMGSLTQVVKKYHKLMNGDKEEFYKIPDSKELISQYMLLYALSLPQGMGINDMMDVNSRYLRVTAMINIASELEKLEMYKWTQNWWTTHSNYTATIEGLPMISGHMRTELTDTLIKSISLALVLVTLIFWFTFKSKFFMIVSTIPNVAPLFIAIGITGWLGVNVDLGMAIVFVIIIGIAIDDTVHFLSKYKSAQEKGKNVTDSIEESLLLGGNAIVITTIILVLGFGTFLFSDFSMYYNFGLMSSIALSFAMILDVLLLPAILIYLDKRKKMIKR
ncbi:efflux RND transporter permease subunit [Sulfurimonas sp.]|uniref:efflux RND transporter permease subunit n=1 Tax=Sulfurimonas sp. TaxID=2022749 RepID=UPI002B472269|nr:MMPL family transporter [Sulfurimonas sp.]